MDVLDENKLSSIRKYFYESVLVSLCVCVVTLFYLYLDLSSYVRDRLINETIATRMIIQENTGMMKETKLSIDKLNNFK